MDDPDVFYVTKKSGVSKNRRVGTYTKSGKDHGVWKYSNGEYTIYYAGDVGTTYYGWQWTMDIDTIESSGPTLDMSDSAYAFVNSDILIAVEYSASLSASAIYSPQVKTQVKRYSKQPISTDISRMWKPSKDFNSPFNKVMLKKGSSDGSDYIKFKRLQQRVLDKKN